MKKAIAFTILLAAFTSCNDSETVQDIETPPETGTPTLVVTTYSTIKPIIDKNCVSCHSSGKSASFMLLTNYAQVKAAVENASLLNRIQLQNGQQGLMPQGGRMSQSNIDLIVKWNKDGLKEK